MLREFAMKPVIVSLLLCVSLLAAACGGGNNTADNSGGEAKFIPDISTPEGATEVYARGIETSNMSLIEMVVLDDEREFVIEQFQKNFAETAKRGIEWKLEFKDATMLDDNTVYSHATYIMLKDGKPTGERQVGWVVFIKGEDGNWRFSRRRSKVLTDEMNKAETPGGNGESTPGDGEKSPGNQPDEALANEPSGSDG